MRYLIAGLLLLLTGAAGPALAQQELAGTWNGLALQIYRDGRSGTWTISMQIDAKGMATKIDYPSLKCGGTLAYIRTVGDIREFRETLTYGLDRCTNNGTVGFRTKLGQLIWYWSGEGTTNPNNIDVAVLKRAN